MSFNALRLEYELEGTLIFCAWKYRMVVVIDDNRLLEYTKIDTPKPLDFDA